MFHPRRTRLVFTCVFGRCASPTVLLLPKPFGGRWQRRLTAVKMHGDKRMPLRVTNSGRVWRKVPESDARSVVCPFSGMTNFGRVWRKVLESEAWSVGSHACSCLCFEYIVSVFRIHCVSALPNIYVCHVQECDSVCWTVVFFVRFFFFVFLFHFFFFFKPLTF